MVGALAISCFLYALSLNIFLEAMKRFFYVEPLENPQLIVIVGGKVPLTLIANVGVRGLLTLIFIIFIVLVEILKPIVLSLPEGDWAINF